jgi:flagellin FlaB
MTKPWRKRAKRANLKRDDAADMGIGTLIIFIAMIMVAAVAAAVMISVANTLRIQGLKQGMETTTEVSTAIKIQSIVGDCNPNGTDFGVNTSTERIQEIKIRISLTPGSPAIDLDDVKIHIITDDRERDLYANTSLEPQDGMSNTDRMFAMTAIRDDDDSFRNNHVMNAGDFILLWIDVNFLNNTYLTMNITPSTDVTIELFPKVGIKSSWSFTTPATYATRYIELG